MSGPLCGPAYYIDPDPSHLAVSAQYAIYVSTQEDGDVVIHQDSREDGDVLISVSPENAPALCRAILKAAGLDPDSALCAVTAKTPQQTTASVVTAQSCVTVTANRT